jgi:hypothetical protein
MWVCEGASLHVVHLLSSLGEGRKRGGGGGGERVLLSLLNGAEGDGVTAAPATY